MNSKLKGINTINTTKTITGQNGMLSVVKSTGVVSMMLKSMLIFLYIYEFNFSAWGFSTLVTSRRVVVILLVAIFIYKYLLNRDSLRIVHQIRTRSIIEDLAILFFILTVISLLISAVVGFGIGDMLYLDAFKFICFILLPIVLFPSIFKSLDEFMAAILLATACQTIVIIVAHENLSFANNLDVFFNDEYTAIHRNGYAGGIACITSTGMFRYSVGLVACMYFIFKTQRIAYLVLYLLFGFVASMIARTGLFVSIIGLMIIIVRIHGWVNAIPTITVYAVLFVIVIGILLFVSINGTDWFEQTFKRMIKLFTDGFETQYLDGYLSGLDTSFPPLKIEYILGTGVVSGISSDGIRIHVDGGYMRIYSAIGAPLAILFYVILFVLLLRVIRDCKDMNTKVLMTFFLIIIIMGEFKEYTILSECHIAIFYTMHILNSLYYKEGNKNAINSDYRRTTLSGINSKLPAID